MSRRTKAELEAEAAALARRDALIKKLRTRRPDFGEQYSPVEVPRGIVIPLPSTPGGEPGAALDAVRRLGPELAALPPDDQLALLQDLAVLFPQVVKDLLREPYEDELDEDEPEAAP